MNVGGYSDPSHVVIEFWYTDMDNGTSAGNAWGFYFDDFEIPEISYVNDFEGAFPPAVYGIVPEYNEDVAAMILDPGETQDITFPAWTPDHLATGLEDTLDYQLVATAYNTPADSNPANDIMSASMSVDYWHDVIVEIDQPSLRAPGDLIFEQIVS